MANKVDFDELKALVSITDVAAWCGIKLKQTGDTYRGDCVLCGAERSFTLTPKKGLFGCFKCQVRGSILDLVHHVKQTANVRDAGLLIQQHFLGNSTNVSAPAEHSSSRSTQSRRNDDMPEGTVPKEQKVGSNPPTSSPLDKVAAQLKTDHDIIPALGLTPEICEALGWGYKPKATMGGRLLIALRTDQGRLVGYLGIAATPELVPLLAFPPNLAEMVLEAKDEKQEDQPAAGKFAHLRLAVNNK
jgi:hypothetical protein